MWTGLYPEEYLTAEQAGQRLGVSTRRVIQLIHAKRLPAYRWHRTWIIAPDDLALVTHRRPGRPKKYSESR